MTGLPTRLIGDDSAIRPTTNPASPMFRPQKMSGSAHRKRPA